MPVEREPIFIDKRRVAREPQVKTPRIAFNNKRFSGELRAFRGAKSLRLVEQESGVSARTIERLERGVFHPTVDILSELCMWMQKSPNHFFDFEADGVPKSEDLLAQELSSTSAKLRHLQRAIADALYQSHQRRVRP